jgi:tetratricopeptide (TPR) repeat protein
MKRLSSSFLILVVIFFSAYLILRTWKGTDLLQSGRSKEILIEAIRLVPRSPDPFYRLGLFYQWDIRSMDPGESLKFFKEAIDRNPFDQRYWLSVAQVLHTNGERKKSKKALEKAVSVFPASYAGRWAAGILLLQQGALEGALPHFTYILSHYPNRSNQVYDVMRRAIPDPDLLFEKLVPKDIAFLNRYVAYLYEIGDPESAKKMWEKKVFYGFKSSREETLRHLHFLIAHGELNEAFRVWNRRLAEEELSAPADGNLITNGSFEQEMILGGGFDWKITNVKGAEICFDPSVAFEGNRSLRIVFDGKENVNFHHVYQYLSLKPDSEYLLSAHVKSRGVTTRSGVKLEVVGIGQNFYQASDPLTGDNEWKELTIAFKTPARSQGGLVRVRREKTEKLDRFISGSVWIDNLRLTEKEAASPPKKR